MDRSFPKLKSLYIRAPQTENAFTIVLPNELRSMHMLSHQSFQMNSSLKKLTLESMRPFHSNMDYPPALKLEGLNLWAKENYDELLRNIKNVRKLSIFPAFVQDDIPHLIYSLPLFNQQLTYLNVGSNNLNLSGQSLRYFDRFRMLKTLIISFPENTVWSQDFLPVRTNYHCF
jgi:hypothetical protein